MRHPTKHIPSTNPLALSMIEVLVAVVIISVAIYGIMLSLGAQQMSEEQMKESRILRQLHYQFVREVLKNQRDQDATNLLMAPPSGGSYPLILTNPALGQGAVVYFNASSPASSIYNSRAHIERNGHTLASSSITVYLPYVNPGNANNPWQAVRP